MLNEVLFFPRLFIIDDLSSNIKRMRELSNGYLVNGRLI